MASLGHAFVCILEVQTASERMNAHLNMVPVSYVELVFLFQLHQPTCMLRSFSD